MSSFDHKSPIHFAQTSDLTSLGPVPHDKYTPEGCWAYRVNVQTQIEYQVGDIIIAASFLEPLSDTEECVSETPDGFFSIMPTKKAMDNETFSGVIIERRRISPAGLRSRKQKETSIYEERGVLKI